MKRTNNELISVKVEKTILLIMCILLFSLPAIADYEISWHTTDGGGGRSSGGDFAIVGTIGQPDAGDMSGGDFQLSGGFWSRGPQALLMCLVNFEHFAEFAKNWLDTPCSAGNNWCDGADLDWSGSVGLTDIRDLAYFWLCQCPQDWPWQ
jgi:hypothetical protein